MKKQRKSTRSIVTNLVIYSIIVIILSIGVTGTVITAFSGSAMKASIAERNLQITASVADQINLYLQDAYAELAIAVDALAINSRDLQREVLLENLSLDQEKFSDFTLIDQKGNVIATSELQSQGKRTDLLDAHAASFKGDRSISNVSITKDNFPYVTIALPAGSSRGVNLALVATLKLQDIWNVVDKISLGDTGFAFLTTDDGHLIAYPNKSMLFEPLTAFLPASYIDNTSRVGSTSVLRDMQGKKILLTIEKVPSTGWEVMIQQDYYDAYMALGYVIGGAAVMGILAALLASLASLFLGRRVLAPLKTLTVGIDAIVAGNLDGTVPVTAKNEIGRLSEAFNTMVSELRFRTAQLKESEETYRLLTENASDIIFALDANGSIQHLNRKFETATGYLIGDFMGRPFSDLLAPDSRIVLDRYLESFSAGTPSKDRAVEIQLIPKRGTPLDIEVRLVNPKDEGSKFHLFGVGRDITERKMLQEKMLQSEKLSTLGEIISGVAHELNNPLTSIIGFSELLSMQERPDDKMGTLIASVHDEALRAGRIVKNLLTFARKHPLERTLCRLNDMVESVVEFRAYEMNVSQIKTITHLDDSLPVTMADTNQLRQVVLNLVNNAIYALKEKRGPRELTISTRAEEETAYIGVKDNGLGIAQSTLPRIFDPFFTTKEEGEGTGLGLSISLGIVHEHGGEITVQSVRGTGTEFVISLPIVAPDLTLAGPDAMSGEVTLPALRTLVIDDEESILELVRRSLEHFGCRVSLVGSGTDAVKLLGSEEFDLVVSDLRMPGMDGWTLYQWIKENKPSLDGRLLFISGDLIGGEMQTMINSTGNSYLMKPFGIKTFVEKIRGILAQSA